MIKGILAALPIVFLLLLMQVAYSTSLATTAWLNGVIGASAFAQVTGAVCAFFISVFPVLLIEKLWPREKQPNTWMLASSIWIVTIIIRAAVAILILRIVQDHTDPLIRFSGEFSAFGMPAALLLYKFLQEFLKYWSHRALHEFSFLWRIHKVHHSTQHLSGLNSVEHFLESILTIAMVTIPLALLIEVNATVVTIFTAIFASWGRYVHANTTVTLGKGNLLVVDNEYHRVHHSRNPEHYNKNYAAVFPVFDMMFGTCYRPTGEHIEVGLPRQPEPRSFEEHVLIPFKSDRLTQLRSDQIR